MTEKNYTHMAIVMDRSGSMVTIKNDMIGGLDSLFAEQAKLDGKCLVDYSQFDTRFETIYEDKPVAEAKAVCEPRGGTALLDAIGSAVTNLGSRLRGTVENKRPDKVLVVVITDGYENSSHVWNVDQVKNLITQQREKYNWEFIFLGATEDAVDTATSYGFAHDSSMNYSNVGNTTNSLNSYVTATRSTGSARFTDADRKSATE